MVPGVGQVATGGKFAGKLAKWMPRIFKAKKSFKPVTGVGKQALKGKTYSIKVAQELQKIMGLKTFKGSLFWKTIGKILDEKDSPFGEDGHEIKRIAEKAAGDPADPETQEIIFDLVEHQGREDKVGKMGEPSKLGRGAAELTMASKETIEEFAPELLDMSLPSTRADILKNRGKAQPPEERPPLPPPEERPELPAGEEYPQLPEPEDLPAPEDRQLQAPAEPESGGALTPDEILPPEQGESPDYVALLAQLANNSEGNQKEDIARFLGNLLVKNQ